MEKWVVIKLFEKQERGKAWDSHLSSDFKVIIYLKWGPKSSPQLLTRGQETAVKLPSADFTAPSTRNWMDCGEVQVLL